jgi:hypothetical protein
MAKRPLTTKKLHPPKKTFICVIFKNNLQTNKKLEMVCGAFAICVAFYWLVPFQMVQ